MELFTPVTLWMKSVPREVSEFKMIISQQHDSTGQVTAMPVAGKITMKLKATNIGLTFLAKWAESKDELRDGVIIFQNTLTGVVTKSYYFKDAYCVKYTEEWKDSTSNTALAHTEEIEISCRVLNIDLQTFHENIWDITSDTKENDTGWAMKLAAAAVGIAGLGVAAVNTGVNAAGVAGTLPHQK